MQQFIKTGIALCLLILPFSYVQAGSCKACEVISLGEGETFNQECRSHACVLIRLKEKVGQIARSPCSSTGNWHFVLDISTDTGKEKYKILYEALHDHRLVDLDGNDRCENYSSRTIEDLGRIRFSSNQSKKQLYGGW